MPETESPCECVRARHPDEIRHIFFLILFFITAYAGYPCHAMEVEIPSSFNPVGSGARAMGMGSAFIAVADDATAASWNPGGLSQLKTPECSVVTSFFQRYEDIRFGTSPEGNGFHKIFDTNINYLSLSYPFRCLGREMIVSLSYQHLYDFRRDWEFTLKEKNSEIGELIHIQDHWNYQQNGRLSAVGISYCSQITPRLSLGFTLNFWKDGLSDNHWQQKYHSVKSVKLESHADDFPFPSGLDQASPDNEDSSLMELDRTESWSFSGFNFNIGLLWYVNPKWTIGLVLKTPFTADLEHKVISREILGMPVEPEIRTSNEELDMPVSYGIGVVRNFSDHFSMSADIYRTEWDKYIARDEHGYETCPVSGKPADESDIDATCQIRIGGEYRIIDKEKGYLIPIRSGIFYDPAPAEGNPDDIWGFSLGLGLTKSDFISLDIAYQYRFGRGIGASIMETLDFSHDVSEHMIYLSLILYE